MKRLEDRSGLKWNLPQKIWTAKTVDSPALFEMILLG